MSRYTAEATTSKLESILDSLKYQEMENIISYHTSAQYDKDDHYTLAIEPELSVYEDEDIMTLTLNPVILKRNADKLYITDEGSDTELGYYNGTDNATFVKAHRRLMKLAAGLNTYTTELAVD